MPITLPSLSRRRFLVGAAALGGLSLMGESVLKADSSRSEDHLALLADIHIHRNKKHVVHNLCVFDRFLQARESVLSASENPARIVVCGDCAYNDGLKEDYATMIEGFAPIREVGVPIHLALGNHDSRKEIFEALCEYEGKPKPGVIPGRINAIVETPRANFFLLDSLVPRNQVTGFMGEEQLQWLGKELDKRPDKPALLFAHHHPMPVPKNPGALIDTPELFEVMRPRKQVKAYIFGHTHRWDVAREDGIYLINIPTIVWKWDDAQPYGWVLATLKDNGMELAVRCLDTAHPKHGDHRSLAWRTG